MRVIPTAHHYNRLNGYMQHLTVFGRYPLSILAGTRTVQGVIPITSPGVPGS